MKTAIMQPYFLPYIGYFQLIASVDLFIVYDNIKYTKKGWINRNRMLQGGTDSVFSLPLRGDSDSLHVCQRELAQDFNPEKLLNRFREAYRSAPYFSAVFPLLLDILGFEDRNLFAFLRNSIIRTCRQLEIATEIRDSSSFSMNHGLKGQERVLALCEAAGASTYINPIGGTSLYSRDAFRARGIELRFLKSILFEYPQFQAPFVPWLSIIDVMMFNPPEILGKCLRSDFELN